MSTPSALATPDSPTELLELFDENNNVLSSPPLPRHIVHSQGLLHRTVHLLIFRRHPTTAQLQVLLQRRSPRKKICAGMWDITLAEHVSIGETYSSACVRGLQEELSLCICESHLTCVRAPYRSYRAYCGGDVVENVFTSTFVATWSDLEGTRTLRANDAEVMDVQWRNVQELQKQVLESSDNNITDWLKWEIEALDILQLAKRHTNTATTTTATATTTN